MASTTRRPSAVLRRAAAEERTLAAVEEMLREGASFTELSVERIATAASLSRSTFYLYFRDKTELALRLGASVRAGVFVRGASWRPDGDPPEHGLAGLAAAYEAIIAQYRTRAASWAAVMEVAGYDEAVRGWLTDGNQAQIDRISALLETEQKEGRTDPALDPVRAAQIMVWGGQQAIAAHLSHGDGDDSAAAWELARAHWYGAYRRPAVAFEGTQRSESSQSEELSGSAQPPQPFTNLEAGDPS
jgi:TetR/AcrR family transcriptional regulator, ethionamide resistance regulator